MSAEIPSASNVPCPQHPEALAQFVCSRCLKAACIECCYSMPDGSVCCKTCYDAEPTLHAPAISTPTLQAPSLRLTPHQPVRTSTGGIVTPTPRQGCVQHPHVMAAARCQGCGAWSCHTCDFVFPGNLHFCPACVTAGPDQISPRRRKYLATAYALAACSSVCIIGTIGVVFVGWVEGSAGEIALGLTLMLLGGLPSIIGTAFAMSARQLGGSNPVSAWIALVWNALLMACLTLMTIIGIFVE